MDLWNLGLVFDTLCLPVEKLGKGTAPVRRTNGPFVARFHAEEGFEVLCAAAAEQTGPHA